MKNAALKSWQTTAAGIAAFVASLGGALHALWDGDPATQAEWSLVVAAGAAMLGLIFARDNDKSSEDAGAK